MESLFLLSEVSPNKNFTGKQKESTKLYKFLNVIPNEIWDFDCYWRLLCGNLYKVELLATSLKVISIQPLTSLYKYPLHQHFKQHFRPEIMNSQFHFPPFKAGPTPMTVTTAGVGAGARGATATGDPGATTGDPGGSEPAVLHKDLLNTNTGCITRPQCWSFSP